jgi:outer membrane lipoprotein-sorting protein
MKKHAIYGLSVLLLVAVASASVYVQGQASAQVNAVLNRMERNNKSIKNLRASITMEKYNSQIREKDRSDGVVIYMPGSGRNSSVRVDWHKPQKETLAVINGKYTLYRPRLNMAYVGNANSNKSKVSNVLGFGLNVSRSQLQQRFETPILLGEETLWGGVRTSHLKLIPKGNASYRHAEIWVDSEGMPVQTKVVEKNDDATTIRLTDIKKNTRVLAEEFRLQLDSNVKKVAS